MWFACWLEPHWQSMVVAATCHGRPSFNHAVRDTLLALFSGLGDASAHDLTQAHRIDAGALQHPGLDATEQGDCVGVGEGTVALADGRAAGFDDDGLAHDVLLMSRWGG